MSQARLIKILVLTFGVPILGAVLWSSFKKEMKLTNDLARTRTTWTDLLELHRRASRGELRMLGPATLESAFIDGGFPPKKPMPSLTPRATLKGGAIGDAGNQAVSVAHYLADEGKFTLFTLPAGKEILPEDAAEVRRRERKLRLIRRDEVTIVVWKSGAWYTALATEMPGADRDLFVDLVLAALDR